MTTAPGPGTNPQHAHYEKLHDEYSAHYYDKTSMAYRRAHFMRPLFAGEDLNGKSLADIAAGDGHSSLLLRDMFPTVCLHGFDISETACAAYRRLVGEATVADALVEIPGAFDAALVVGGLHHFVSNLDAAMTNIAKAVKPGGTLYVIEPSSGFFLNKVREFWYRRDRLFDADTERALDLPHMASRYGDLFTLEWGRHFGGPAYFLILNSLVMRVPLWLKPVLAPPCLALEPLYEMLPGTAPFPMFMARFRRNG